jgi:hypothetical protein
VSDADPPYSPPEHRLDPDQAAALRRPPAGSPKSPLIDPRPYRWIIGIFGLVLVIVFSVTLFVSRGIQTAGVPPGKPLHHFVAPLATSRLNLDANTNPRCDPAHPNPQGLNVCGRTPIVLAFFAAGSPDCRRQVDAMQSLTNRYSADGIQFAAVAVRAGRTQTASLVRSHHWTIPVAYDRDGAIGALYGVDVCPLLELAYRGGIVADRLIGKHWLQGAALAARVQRLVGR